MLEFDRGLGGGNLRVYLRIGVPEPEVELESPWWRVDTAPLDPDEEPIPGYDPSQRTLEAALARAWEWLETYGWAWFDQPFALTPSEWGLRHGVIFRDHRNARLELSWPEAMSLNERVIRILRCVPQWQGRPALHVRHELLGCDAISLGEMPLANALELKAKIEAEGLLLDVQRIDSTNR